MSLGWGAACIFCFSHLPAVPYLPGSDSLLSHPPNDSAFYSPPRGRVGWGGWRDLSSFKL